jgi:hypothetical protein
MGGIGLAKLTQFQSPLAAKGNILSPKTWFSVILGMVVLLITWALASRIFGIIRSRAPGPVGGWLSGGPGVATPNAPAAQKASGPVLNVY